MCAKGYFSCKYSRKPRGNPSARYAPTPATLTIESVPYDVPTCFNEMPAYKITPAGQASRQANKSGMSEEERQRTLEEVNRQQAEFGVQK